MASTRETIAPTLETKSMDLIKSLELKKIDLIEYDGVASVYRLFENKRKSKVLYNLLVYILQKQADFCSMDKTITPFIVPWTELNLDIMFNSFLVEYKIFIEALSMNFTEETRGFFRMAYSSSKENKARNFTLMAFLQLELKTISTMSILKHINVTYRYSVQSIKFDTRLEPSDRLYCIQYGTVGIVGNIIDYLTMEEGCGLLCKAINSVLGDIWFMQSVDEVLTKEGIYGSTKCLEFWKKNKRKTVYILD